MSDKTENKGKYKIYSGNIPFERDNHLQMVDYCAYKDEFYRWKENHRFLDDIVYENYLRGRSSVTFVFRSLTRPKTKYFMCFTDFHDAIPYMTNGNISGEFVYCKRGSSYGIRLTFDQTEDFFSGRIES